MGIAAREQGHAARRANRVYMKIVVDQPVFGKVIQGWQIHDATKSFESLAGIQNCQGGLRPHWALPLAPSPRISVAL